MNQEEQTHDLDVVIYGIRGEEIDTVHVSSVEELTRVVLAFNGSMQWSVDDMDDYGTGTSFIGTGVIPDHVVEKYGMENIRLSKGSGYHC